MTPHLDGGPAGPFLNPAYRLWPDARIIGIDPVEAGREWSRRGMMASPGVIAGGGQLVRQ